jgi:hypothetical protein
LRMDQLNCENSHQGGDTLSNWYNKYNPIIQLLKYINTKDFKRIPIILITVERPTQFRMLDRWDDVHRRPELLNWDTVPYITFLNKALFIFRSSFVFFVS